MTARRDATLSLVVLGAVAVALTATGTGPPALVPAAGGVLAVVLVEAVLGRYDRTVRAWWARPAVQALALLAALASVGAGAALAPHVALSAAAGAVVGYLSLLVLVSVSVVPPPSAWWG